MYSIRLLHRYIASYKNVTKTYMHTCIHNYNSFALLQANKLDEALSQYFGAPQAYDSSAAGNFSIIIITSCEVIMTSCDIPTDDGHFSEPVRKCPICKNSDMAVRKKQDGW